jgi:hypothetical protein
MNHQIGSNQLNLKDIQQPLNNSNHYDYSLISSSRSLNNDNIERSVNNYSNLDNNRYIQNQLTNPELTNYPTLETNAEILNTNVVYEEVNINRMSDASDNHQVYQQPNTGNFTTLNVSLSDKSQFKSTPVFTPCPNCKELGFTRVSKKLSFNNLVCCLVFSTLPWVLFQSLRGKDINCQNADHFCSKCNKEIAKYNAC